MIKFIFLPQMTQITAEKISEYLRNLRENKVCDFQLNSYQF